LAKKKIRVSFKKNRQKRTRDNNLTEDFRNDNQVRLDHASAERVRAKGDLSRKRTIVTEGTDKERADAGDDQGSLISVDLTECLHGRVIRVHGLVSVVEADDGDRYRCNVRRILKTMAIDGRNVIAVGDRVWFRPEPNGEGMVEKIDLRTRTISRGYRKHKHVLVSNVDRILIVSAFDEPGLKLPLIDRYLISAEIGRVQPIIILNKADLVDVVDFQWIVGLYTQLGYETLITSAADGRGIDRLRSFFGEGTTAFSGQSGVGKSSLLNAVQPGLNLRIGEVAEWTGKGKHTTSNSELIRLESGGFVVDTPGLRQFELWGVEQAEVEAYFVEFRPFIPKCKYPDCSHTHESDCAVKDAVHLGLIHAGRYESYMKLYFGQPLEEG
jgi:ribosome biogenesis GTPase